MAPLGVDSKNAKYHVIFQKWTDLTSDNLKNGMSKFRAPKTPKYSGKIYLSVKGSSIFLRVQQWPTRVQKFPFSPVGRDTFARSCCRTPNKLLLTVVRFVQ